MSDRRDAIPAGYQAQVENGPENPIPPPCGTGVWAYGSRIDTVPSPVSGELGKLDAETLGRLVRETWVEWAKTQPGAKRSWLLPWEELMESEREVDRRIGAAVRDAVLDRLRAFIISED